MFIKKSWFAKLLITGMKSLTNFSILVYLFDYATSPVSPRYKWENHGPESKWIIPNLYRNRHGTRIELSLLTRFNALSFPLSLFFKFMLRILWQSFNWLWSLPLNTSLIAWAGWMFISLAPRLLTCKMSTQ